MCKHVLFGFYVPLLLDGFQLAKRKIKDATLRTATIRGEILIIIESFNHPTNFYFDTDSRMTDFQNCESLESLSIAFMYLFVIYIYTDLVMKSFSVFS